MVKLTVAISNEAAQKLRELANYRCRSLSKQLEYMIMVAKFLEVDKIREMHPPRP